MKEIPTLLEWLTSQGDYQMANYLNADVNIAFTLINDLKYYGLLAFQRLPSNSQLLLLQAYCHIYR